MDYASAATLGYITDNLRGSYTAIKLLKSYKNMHLPMTPTSRGRTPAPFNRQHSRYKVLKATRTAARKPAGRATARSRSSGRAMSISSAGSGKNTTTSHNSNNVRTAVVHKYGSKRVNFKKTKRVKISRKFVKKVEGALEPEEPSGTYTSFQYGTIVPFENQQFVTSFGNTAGDDVGIFFGPTSVLHAASVLWNKKTNVFNATIGDVGNFNNANTKVRVIHSSSKTEFTNNTQRTLFFTIYEGAPKNIQATNTFIGQWTQAAVEETTSGINIGGTCGANNLDSKPQQYPNFNKFWKCAETSVTLEPGQRYEYNLRGPSEKLYDYQKFWNGANWMYTQKMQRSVMIAIKSDLVSALTAMGADGIPLRASLPAFATTGYGLLWETKILYKLAMPKQTGWTATGLLPGAGPIPLDMVHNAKAYYTSATTVGGRTVLRIDDLTPVVPEAPPV